jgi:hypothetical protein
MGDRDRLERLIGIAGMLRPGGRSSCLSNSLPKLGSPPARRRQAPVSAIVARDRCRPWRRASSFPRDHPWQCFAGWTSPFTMVAIALDSRRDTCRKAPMMSNPFFDHPILNSPYKYPRRHWELDEAGQPTQKIVETRRGAKFITPIPTKGRCLIHVGQELLMDILQETRQTQVQFPVEALTSFFAGIDAVRLRQVRRGVVVKADVAYSWRLTRATWFSIPPAVQGQQPLWRKIRVGGGSRSTRPASRWPWLGRVS